MADLSITVALVARTSGGVNKSNNAGATITAGQVVYLDANGVWQLGLNDTAVHAGSLGTWGISLHAALSGQPLAVLLPGAGAILIPGATVVVGTIYAFSANAGKIAPYTDLATTNKITIIGIGATSSTIDMGIGVYTGYAIP